MKYIKEQEGKNKKKKLNKMKFLWKCQLYTQRTLFIKIQNNIRQEESRETSMNV
jgi:hypothetical protein